MDASGKVSLRGRALRVGRAFAGEPVALRETDAPGRLLVYYGSHRVRELNL